MSEHVGYVVQVNSIRPHLNADRLQIATFFGNETCVDLSVQFGDIGIYFPTDLQLSVEYCEANNLIRKKDENGNNIGGYMDPAKRNVRTIKLRGEKSDGLYMPISSLVSFGDISTLHIGDPISVFNGHEICCKYIPPITNKAAYTGPRIKVRKRNIPISPLFAEHADTEQLAYNLDAFKPGDLIEITLKMHGTSQRTAYLPVFKKYKRNLLDILLKRPGTPVYDWGYVNGTRRTVMSTFDGGFYGSNDFREPHAKFFEGKLHKGEEVFYEVVGFQTNGQPIMGTVNNKKTNDKEFVKQYGPTTTFSYGCNPEGKKVMYGMDDDGQFAIETPIPQSDFYVYRMTMINEDGDIVEYTPDFMRYRCEQMGCKTVPMFCHEYIPDYYQLPDGVGSPTAIDAGAYVKNLAEEFYDGPDPIGKSHVREGVVIRIINRPKFTAYKHKNFSFKCIEGIAKAEAEAPDIEEAQEVLNEEMPI